jgi:hypothetical protein
MELTFFVADKVLIVVLQSKPPCNLEFVEFVASHVPFLCHSLRGGLQYDEVVLSRDLQSELLQYAQGIGHVGVYDYWVCFDFSISTRY